MKEFDFEAFKRGEIVVICKNTDEYNNFIEIINKNNIDINKLNIYAHSYNDNDKRNDIIPFTIYSIQYDKISIVYDMVYWSDYMQKTVKFKDYEQALNEIQEKLNNNNIRFYNMSSYFKQSISIGINWCALGTVSTEEAKEFAQDLIRAAELAENFKYNGYMLED